jgi:L-fuconolactonase
VDLRPGHGGYQAQFLARRSQARCPGGRGRRHRIRGLRAVAAAALSYDVLVLPHQLPAATAAADAVPGLTMILDHAGKPQLARGDLGAWPDAIRAFAARPNTRCKLSGLVTEAALGAATAAFAPASDVKLSAFGPHRVMFGSDWPVCLPAGWAGPGRRRSGRR